MNIYIIIIITIIIIIGVSLEQQPGSTTSADPNTALATGASLGLRNGIGMRRGMHSALDAVLGY